MSDPVLDEKSEKFASFQCDGNQPLCTQQREYSASSRRKGPIYKSVLFSVSYSDFEPSFGLSLEISSKSLKTSNIELGIVDI